MSKTPPTLEQYSAYQGAWGWFNKELFSGSLMPCQLTFSRHRGSLGFFAPRRWQRNGVEIHEIALNPAGLSKPLEEIMSTLVHEMVHQWQFDHGTPPRKGYHDLEWARKMEDVGLIPSDTGQPGGNKTGQHMSDYIDPNGRFVRALKRMPEKYVLPWISDEQERPPKPKVKRPTRIKLTCPDCKGVCWVFAQNSDPDCQSPDNLSCDDCNERMLTRTELRDWKEDNRDDD